MKTCTKCGETKLVIHFGSHAGCRDGLRPCCKECVRRYTREYIQQPHVKARRAEQTRRARAENPTIALRQTLRAHGMTPEDYRTLLAVQGGRCAICGATEARKDAGHRLLVDHNHVTGRIRGLLCRKCNSGLGMFNDDADLMAKAAEYLK